MKKKLVWVALSCLMVVGLILASCAPAAEPTPAPTPTVPTSTPTPTPTPTEKSATPEAKIEMVKVRLTKTDGTVVEKMVEKPKYGGVLREGYSVYPLFFDDVLGHVGSAQTLHLTNEELTTGDWAKGPAGTEEASFLHTTFPPATSITGAIAESWEFPDANTITYHIRKGIHWHDKPPANGRELNATDVAFSLNRLWDTPTAYHYTGYPKKTFIESITAPDKWTVIIKCLPGMLGQVWEVASDHSKIVCPEVIAKYGDMRDWRDSCGTGPYMLVDYVNMSSATFERNPNYWLKDPIHPENTLPYPDGTRWVIVPDTSTRISAIRTGKIDAYATAYQQPIQWEDAESLLRTNPELKYLRYTIARPNGICWRVDTAPFNDVRVRRALHMAVDHQTILDTYYGGYGGLNNFPLANIAELQSIYTPLEELPQSTKELFEYHPDKAKQLLAEAGYPNGFKTEVVCLQTDVDMLSIFKAYWAKIGVDLELVIKETGAWTSIGNTKTHKHMITASLPGDNPFRLTKFVPGNRLNYSMVDDTRLNDAYWESFESYMDEPKRRQIFKEITPYILDQAYYLQFPGSAIYNFWQPWVKGYHGEAQVGYMNNYDFSKYIWIDQDLKEEMTGTR